jgi:hypothetical protein
MRVEAGMKWKEGSSGSLFLQAELNYEANIDFWIDVGTGDKDDGVLQSAVQRSKQK